MSDDRIVTPDRQLSRRKLLGLSTAGLAGLIAAGSEAELLAQTPQAPASVTKRPDPIKSEMVKEFVIAAHGKFDRVKTMLEEEPALLNAVWDWGGGDFEAAIGGAGHMGNREIALYLIERGARMDLFVATMLGHLDIVKSTLVAFPNLLNSKGPHGIPLMTHAKRGGEDAKKVLEYLESLSPKPPL
jgi:hypothetical protein